MNNKTLILVFSLFLALPLAATAKGNAKDGQTKAAACAACHGADGNTPTPGVGAPKLAGQHYDYLVHTLKSYKSGERKNPIMNGLAAPLSVQDIEDLSAYFSGLPTSLYLIKETRGVTRVEGKK
jgi:cytochrome c553